MQQHVVSFEEEEKIPERTKHNRRKKPDCLRSCAIMLSIVSIILFIMVIILLASIKKCECKQS